jgi:hypothetical protein
MKWQFVDGHMKGVTVTPRHGIWSYITEVRVDRNGQLCPIQSYQDMNVNDFGVGTFRVHNGSLNLSFKRVA